LSGRKTFTAGEVLQAADVNDFLMDQSVMVFAGTAARGSAIPSPSEGMVTYRSDDDAVEVYDGSSWNAVGPGKILQVVSTTKTDPTTIALSAGNFSSNISGLEATITPISTSSKILVQVSLTGARVNDLPFLYARLVRGATPIGVGTAAGSRPALTMSSDIITSSRTNSIVTISSATLDTPASTSALTYGVQLYSPDAQTYAICRSAGDSDNSANVRTISSITLMEVAG